MEQINYRLKPKKQSRRWWFLKNDLEGKGFAVYPTELECLMKHCIEPSRCRVVDVAAFRNGAFYAFEYKSAGDPIYAGDGKSTRLLTQISNYASSFDFVVTVVEVPRHDVSMNLKRGVRIRAVLRAGSGLWTVEFNRNPYSPDTLPKITELVEPTRQNPNAESRAWIMNRFKRHVWGIPVPEHPDQKQIEKWF